MSNPTWFVNGILESAKGNPIGPDGNPLFSLVVVSVHKTPVAAKVRARLDHKGGVVRPVRAWCRKPRLGETLLENGQECFLKVGEPFVCPECESEKKGGPVQGLHTCAGDKS